MSRRRYLFDALTKETSPTDNVRDFRLIDGDFDRTWPDVICGGVDVMEIGVHSVLSLALRPWLGFIMLEAWRAESGTFNRGLIRHHSGNVALVQHSRAQQLRLHCNPLLNAEPSQCRIQRAGFNRFERGDSLLGQQRNRRRGHGLASRRN